MSRRLFHKLSGIVFCSFGSLLFAQEPLLPPIPDVDGLSQQIEIDLPPMAENGDISNEILTRGPIHEAFAEQYAADPTEGLIVPNAPPELIDELPPEEMPEGTNVEWIPGYWAFDEDIEDFIWISGFWRDVPLGQRWVPGYWTEVDQGYQWVAGFWTSSEDEELSYLPTPPNSLEQGPNIAAPGDNYFWVPGNWVYESYDYRWRAGYWAPSYNDFVWIPARYQWTPRGYVHCTGYWDYPLARRGVLFSPVRFQNHRFPRRFRGYRYQPNLTVATGPLLIHLFSRPRYRHYYYGDYYAARYRERGIVPFTSINRFSSRGYRYDPLCAYYQAGSRRTTFDRLVGWNRYFDQRQDLRPPRTFAATNDFARTRNRDIDQVVLTQSILGVSINDLKRSNNRSDRQFKMLSNDVRNRLSNESLTAARRLTDDRIRFESKISKADLGKIAGRDDDRGNGRPIKIESLKLPEVVSLGSKLNNRESANSGSRSRGAIGQGLANRSEQAGDRGSRSQLESLREQIEEKRRELQNRVDDRGKVRDSSRSRGSSNPNLSDSIRERIEAAREKQSNSVGRGSSAVQDLNMPITGNSKTKEKPSKTNIRDLEAIIDGSSKIADTKESPTSRSGVSSSLRERIEAARQMRDGSKADDNSSNRNSDPRVREKEDSSRPNLPIRSSEPGQIFDQPRSVDKGSRSQSDKKSKEIDIRSNQPNPVNRTESNSQNDLRQRIEDARKAAADRQIRSSSSSDRNSQNDLKQRIEAARQAAEAQRSRSTNSSPRSSQSDLKQQMEASRRAAEAQQNRSASGKSRSSQSSLQQRIEAARKAAEAQRNRSSSSSARSSQSDLQQRIDAARKAAAAAQQSRSSSKSTRSSQSDDKQRIESSRKATEAQGSRSSSGSSSKASRQIESRSPQPSSRDSSTSRKSVQDAINRARQEAAKRAQNSRERGSSSTGRGASSSSRESTAKSIRSLIESRSSSSKAKPSREKPSKATSKSDSKKK